MEAEKYTMAEDIENLQEELEDANAQQKRYYEALMTKDEQTRSLKATCRQLQKVDLCACLCMCLSIHRSAATVHSG